MAHGYKPFRIYPGYQSDKFSAYENIDIWPGAENAMANLITTIYQGHSPQILKTKQGVLNGGVETYVESFNINKSVTDALISVSWLGSEPLEFELRKNGVLMVPSKPTVESGQFMMQAYDLKKFPQSAVSSFWSFMDFIDSSFKTLRAMEKIHAVMASAISQGKLFLTGEFTLSIKRKSTVSSNMNNIHFNIIVIVDEKVLKIRPSRLDKVFYTEEKLPVEILISEDGTP